MLSNPLVYFWYNLCYPNAPKYSSYEFSLNLIDKVRKCLTQGNAHHLWKKAFTFIVGLIKTP